MNTKSSRYVVLIAVLLCTGIAANAQTKAALIRNIDRPTAQPVNNTCTLESPYSGGECKLYTVPSGKLLVVETVGYRAAIPTGYSLNEVIFAQDYFGNSLSFRSANSFLVTPMFVSEVSGIRVYAGSQALKMYVDEGKVLGAQVYGPGVEQYSQSYFFSGYLVDK